MDAAFAFSATSNSSTKQSAVTNQEATLPSLKSTIAQQMKAVTARLKEHDDQIQKVSAELELQRPPVQTVVNNQ
jgi:hypothetical protein